MPDATTNPWDFKEGGRGFRETPAAYRTFQAYLHLGPKRTLAAAAKVLGIPAKRLSDYSSRYCWPERTAAHDAAQVKKWAQEVREDFETSHKAELLKFRQEQQRRAKGLGEVADLLINVTRRTLEEMDQQQVPVEPEQLAAVCRTAAALADAAMNTGAAALGVDDLIDAINPEAG